MSKNLAHRVASICIDEVFPFDGDDDHNSGENNNNKLSHVPVVKFEAPSELDNKLQGCLEINEKGCNDDEFVDLCNKCIEYSCKSWHPNFMLQFITGIDKYGLCASWLLETLNSHGLTYETGPFLTLVQRAVVTKVLELFKFPGGIGDGAFCPGASLANMYAMMLARHRRFSDARNKGMCGLPPMAIFTSQSAHYSVEKGAIFLGFGLDSVYKVETDMEGRMLPDKLREAVKLAVTDGRVPLLVNATAGTTVLGAFDNFEAIAGVCDEFKTTNANESIWLHIDGAFGGCALFSKQTEHLLKGCGLFDSITWDLHKIAGVLLQCSLIVTKHRGLLQDAISLCANYLFQSDKGYDNSYDCGDKIVQCSQKADALKCWLVLKGKGLASLETEIDSLMALSLFTQRKLGGMTGDGFHLVLPQFQYVNICFWYVPTWMRSDKDNGTSHPLLGRVAPLVRKRLRDSGQLQINHCTHKGLPNFFRIICINRLLHEADIVDILNLIRKTAENLKMSDLSSE